MATIRATVRKYGTGRLHIEIPKLYLDKFRENTVVVVRPLKEVEEDEYNRN